MGVFEDYEKAVWDVDHDNCTLGELEEAEQRLKDSIVEWIPVTERLPDKEGVYLVTTKDWVSLTSTDTHIIVSIGNFHMAHGFDHWVTAWAELPKPYEEGAEDDSHN